MVNNSSTGGHGREGEVRAIDGAILSDREDSGLAALEGLSLEELASIASQEIGESRRLQAEAVGLARRSSVMIYRAGRTLWCARKKLKGERSWTKWQKAHGIPITSAWQAIELYEKAGDEDAVAGLTRSQALQKYGITKPKKAQPQQAPVEVSRAPVGGGTVPVQDAPPQSPDLRLVPEANDEVGGTAPDRKVAEPDRAVRAEEPQADSTTPPAAETLLLIVRRLETLERDIRGIALGDEAHALIDQGIATLRRLRGDAVLEAEAA